MLTPLDIENIRFQKALKGYNVEEVDDFLDQLSADYEKIYKENLEYKEQIESSKKELEHYKNVEHTLQDTLIMAQKASEDIKKIAQQKADQIIKDAESNVKDSVNELAKQEFELRIKMEDTKKQFNAYKARMEALLISQLELLKDVNDDKE
ncbi:MAG: DivIVA domain-containing protein [Candidatus Scatovivens sp.]